MQLQFVPRKNSTNNRKIADGGICTLSKKSLEKKNHKIYRKVMLFIFVMVYKLKTKILQIGSYNFVECITANHHHFHHNCHLSPSFSSSSSLSLLLTMDAYFFLQDSEAPPSILRNVDQG